MGKTFSDMIRQTAVFGDGNTEIAPTGLHMATDQPKEEERATSSPTKDPNRRLRIEETPGSSKDDEDLKPKSKKVSLASMAIHSPIVRLTRVQDVALSDKSLLGTKVEAFSQLGHKLHEQR